MESQAKQIFVFSNFRFHAASGELTQSGVRIRISKQVADLLTVLLANAGQLVTRQQIREVLWPDQEFINYDKIITNTVSRLRSIFQDDPAAPQFIESIPKRGYRLVAEVHEEELPASIAPAFQSPSPPDREPSNGIQGFGHLPRFNILVSIQA